MLIGIAGHTGTGNTSLAQRLSRLFPHYGFIDLSYSEAEQHIDPMETCDGVIITVNPLEGPMPGTKAAISDCKSSNRKIIGFCMTHLDVFDKQSKYGPHIKELVEVEARELASCYEYLDDKIPAVKIGLVTGCDEALKDFFHNVLTYYNSI
ncbi:MAG: hypothetical protein ACOX6S_01425 [Clostridia bacterium]|jgi:translation elongation factor EF-Tu-like GTPase